MWIGDKGCKNIIAQSLGIQKDVAVVDNLQDPILLCMSNLQV